MGKNPCMQRTLRALKASKELRAQVGAAGRRLAGSNGSSKSGFTSEEIMRTNLECVRPCYGSGVAGEEMWHDEARQHGQMPSLPCTAPLCRPEPKRGCCASSECAWRLWAS